MRGGKRPGAGRPPGAKQIRSLLDRAKFQGEAQRHLSTALDALVDVAENGSSESARVSAATELINRAVGRSVAMFETSDVGAELLRVMLNTDQEELDKEGVGHITKIELPNLFDE
ncbi:MAG: hypothetical protein ABJX82_08850 [Paracoccaceae bacterium]|nr:hypothetical protein K3729_18430 [Rhodobacteraceae bacterium S2214]